MPESVDETRPYPTRLSVKTRLDQPQPESRRDLAPGVLLLKSTYLSDALKHAAAYVEQPPKYKLHRGHVLGQGSFGTVCAGSDVGHSDRSFAIKLFDRIYVAPGKNDAEAMSEVRRCVALPRHTHIVPLLDIEIFRQDHPEPPCIGLVFQRHDSDVRHLLQTQRFTRAGMRHVLSSLLDALAYLHQHKFVHADLKPANVFLKGRGRFQDDWARLVQRKSSSEAVSAAAAPVAGAVAESAEGEPLAITYQLPVAFTVVLGDLGMTQLPSPQERNELKPRPSDKSLPICTLQYRSPDLCFGNQQYGTDVDMWSLGCLAAELFLQAPLVLGTELFGSGTFAP